jgi:PQQ-like domain
MDNKSSKMKTTATIILVLLMAMITLTANNPVKAQTTYTNLRDGASTQLPNGVTPDVTFETKAHLSFRPNPVGVGQPLLVNLWIQPPIHVTHYFKDAYMVKFTKPDGTTEEVGPLTGYKGDTTAWFEKIIDQVGTWKIEFDFIGGYYPAGNYTMVAGTFSTQMGKDTQINFPQSVYYKPSIDGPYEFVAQQDMVASWPQSPLPTDYWTRPISPENREWWSIAGGYPATGIVGGGPGWPADTNTYTQSTYKFTPYVQAPNTAHVVWKKQGAISGLIGGTLGQISLYDSTGSPNIVYAGRCYQTITKIVDGKSTSVWQCYDLRTGEVYWERTDVTQIPTMLNYRERTIEMVPGEEASKTGLGVTLLYVGGGRLIEYDPWIGDVNRNISISPMTTGTLYASPEIFLSVQSLGGGNYRLINWTLGGYLAHYSGFTEPVVVKILNNVSWPFSSLGTVDYESMIAVSTQSIPSNSAGGTESQGSISYNQRIMAANLLTGNVLWNITTDSPFGGFYSGSTTCADHGKYAVRLNDGHWHCWDLNSGKELWVSELSSWPWGTFGIYGVSSYGGLLIYPQYDGVVAYNWTNGKIVWQYRYEAQYPYETVFGSDYPFYDSAIVIADGKLYTSNTEHSPSNPIARGQKLHCINVTTGEGMWNITGSMSPSAVTDGYLVASNRYDGYLYVFGKGQSATTVSAPQTAITQGQSIVLTGTVLDQSPAQSGKACVSADSMATYMEYLHMQKEIPSNVTVTGVPVSIDAMDPNGNTVHIATVTSDMSGTYSYMWTPDIAGKYTITATFTGTNSYSSSWAETAVGVAQAPQATATSTPTAVQQSSTDMYLAASTIAIIIAIAIVGLLMLRKRP